MTKTDGETKPKYNSKNNNINSVLHKFQITQQNNEDALFSKSVSNDTTVKMSRNCIENYLSKEKTDYSDECNKHVFFCVHRQNNKQMLLLNRLPLLSLTH